MSPNPSSYLVSLRFALLSFGLLAVFSFSIYAEETNNPQKTSDNLIKQAKAGFVRTNTQVPIVAGPSDIVIMIIGGSNNGPNGRSSQTGKSTLLGGNEMPNQGFKLIRMVGDDDSKIEAWAKIWNQGNRVLVPQHSKDAVTALPFSTGAKSR